MNTVSVFVSEACNGVKEAELENENPVALLPNEKLEVDAGVVPNEIPEVEVELLAKENPEVDPDEPKEKENPEPELEGAEEVPKEKERGAEPENGLANANPWGTLTGLLDEL
jgi:hypothetical protein